MRAYELISTSLSTRSGCVALNRSATGPPLSSAISVARSTFSASMTTRTSSIHCSIVGSALGGTGSDAPVPGWSNCSRRPMAASELMNGIAVLKSRQPSMCEVKLGTQTRSGGPSPKTVYAMVSPAGFLANLTAGSSMGVSIVDSRDPPGYPEKRSEAKGRRVEAAVGARFEGQHSDDGIEVQRAVDVRERVAVGAFVAH